MAKVTLGNRYRDSITGFEGVATARYEYLHGCVRYQLEGELAADGKMPSEAFDEQRLVPVGGGPVEATATSGGPYPDVKRPETPRR